MTIPDILAECDKALALAEEATPGPWLNHDPGIGDSRTVRTQSELTIATVLSNHEGDLIANFRTFTPDAALALKVAIEELNAIEKLDMDQGLYRAKVFARSALQSIIDSFTHEQH